LIVLVTGSRHFPANKAEVIHEALRRLPKGSLIIHGGAKGADTLAEYYAKLLALDYKAYPINWEEERAKGYHDWEIGHNRNQLMLDDNPNIEVCYAFHENLQINKPNGGTRDMIERCLKKKIRVVIFPV